MIPTDPTIADLQRQLRDACEQRRKHAQDTGADAERQYWLVQRRIVESSISARELPRPAAPLEPTPVLYTHHPAMLAAYPDRFVRTEVIVDVDLAGPDGIVTEASIDAAFDAGMAGRLIPKLERANAGPRLILNDQEPLPYRAEDVAAYLSLGNRFHARVRAEYPEIEIALYSHAGMEHRLLVGEARIAEGHPWWSLPEQVADIAGRRAQMDATLAAMDLPSLDIDYLTPVCYQSRHFYATAEDRRYRAADWLLPTLARAAATGHEVVPIIWLRSFTPTPGETVDADLDELRSICQIIHDAGHRRVMLWVGHDDPIDTPEFAARLAVVMEFFGL